MRQSQDIYLRLYTSSAIMKTHQKNIDHQHNYPALKHKSWRVFTTIFWEDCWGQETRSIIQSKNLQNEIIFLTLYRMYINSLNVNTSARTVTLTYKVYIWPGMMVLTLAWTNLNTSPNTIHWATWYLYSAMFWSRVTTFVTKPWCRILVQSLNRDNSIWVIMDRN